MISQQFYMMRGIRDNEDRITIRFHMKKAFPILWNRGGEYRLVPKEVVQNAIALVTELGNSPVKTLSPQVCIYWDQDIPVTNQVGRLLTGGE